MVVVVGAVPYRHRRRLRDEKNNNGNLFVHAESSPDGDENDDDANEESRVAEEEGVEKFGSPTPSRDDDDDSITEQQRVEMLAKVLARRYVWRTVAGVSMLLGVGCLVMAHRLRTDFNVPRRFTKRR